MFRLLDRKLAVVLFLTTCAFATTRFLSPVGTDSGNCSVTACQTLAYVDTQVAAGDIVQLHAGYYQLTTPFSPATSGSSGSPITYENYPGENAIIIGTIKPSGVLPTWNTDDTAATATCVANTPGGTCQAYYVDLNSASYNDFDALFYGTPAIRRQEPTRFNVVKTPNTNAAPQCVSGIIPPHTSATIADANSQCGGAAYSIGGTTYNTAGISPPCSGSTPYWCGYSNLQYSAGDIDCTWHDVANGYVKIEGFESWSKNMERLGTCDTVNNIAHMTGASFYVSGNTGFVAGHTYILKNVLEKAQAGDWYLDHHNALAASGFWRLYIFADTSKGENPNVDTVYFPQQALNTAVQPSTGGQLIKDTAASYLTFLGGVGGGTLSFVGDNWYPGPQGLPEQTGSPLVPGALSFSGVTNITLDTLQIYHIQGWAIDFQGATTNNVIQNSALYDIGAGAIRIGAKATSSDTANSIPAFFTVQQNKVDSYEQVDIAGESPGIFVGDAHDITVSHNDVTGGYTGCYEVGFGLNRDATGGSTAYFMYNLTFDHNTCSGASGAGGNWYAENADFGGFHIASNLSVNCPTTGQPSLGPPNTYCTHITNNVVHDLPSNYNDQVHQGGMGIYFEQGASNVEAQNNLIYRMGHACMFQNIAGTTTGKNLPMYNLFQNNICGPAGPQQQNLKGQVKSGTTSGNAFFAQHNIFWFNSAVGEGPQSIPGKFACFADDGITPVDCTTRFTFAQNDWWDINRQNLTFDTCTTVACTAFNTFTGTPWATTEDVGSVSTDPHFVNPLYGVDDWHITTNLSSIGFLQWDYTTAGANLNTVSIPAQPRPYLKRFVNSTTDFTPGFIANPVTAYGGSTASGNFQLGSVGPAALTITSPLLPDGTNGVAYGPYTQTATGGIPPYTWSWVSQPTGLTLTGPVVAGTPTVNGTYNLTLTVKDSSTPQHTVNRPDTVVISGTPPALKITSAPFSGGTQGTFYSQTAGAVNGTPPYTWSISVGSPPPGLSLAASTGTLSGTPTTAGTTAFTLKVTDNVGATDTQSESITISATGASQENAYCLPGDVPNFGTSDGPAQLPRSCVYTARSASPSTGTIWAVLSVSDWTTQWAKAACGDIIELGDAGHVGLVLTGNLTIPTKTCSAGKWITLRAYNWLSAGPAEGTRVSPCWWGVASMTDRPAFNCTSTSVRGATIIASSTSSPTLTISANTQYLRIMGIKLTRPVLSNSQQTNTVSMANGGMSHIIFDQVWGAGTNDDETRRFINFDTGSYIAVVNSFFTDYHCIASGGGIGGACSDSQVFAGGINGNALDTDHAWKHYNNYVESSTEQFEYGGGAAAIVPCDLEERNNLMWKPLYWNPASPDYTKPAGSTTPFVVKNQWETKSSCRVLIEGNVMQNVWNQGQVGEAVTITPKSQASGGVGICPICFTTDITIRYNIIHNANQAFQIGNSLSNPCTSNCQALAGNNYSIHDNVADGLGWIYANGGVTSSIQGSTDPGAQSSFIQHDYMDNHNTYVFANPTATGTWPSFIMNMDGPCASTDGVNCNIPYVPSQTNRVFINNIVAAGQSGFGGSFSSTVAHCAKSQVNNPVGMSNAGAWFAGCWGGSSQWDFNCVVGGTHSGWSWPGTNNQLLTNAYSAVLFNNYNNGSGGDYTLQASSPCHNKASDGTDMGANIPLVNMKTAGVASF